MSLAALPLQDAVLADLRFDWSVGRCTLGLRPADMAPHVLVFSGVSGLQVPCVQPWGPSAALVAARETHPGRFEFELHSGDVLRIAAEKWVFRRDRRLAAR
jgi:hypothetical protein